MSLAYKIIYYSSEFLLAITVLLMALIVIGLLILVLAVIFGG